MKPQAQLRRGRPPRPPPPPSLSPSPSPSPSPPPSPPRRNLRPRLTPRPLIEDFYGLSSSSGEESEAERKGMRRVKLVTNLSGEIGKRRRRHVGESDLSSSSYVEDDGESGEEVKRLNKKRRISGGGGGLGGKEQRLGFDEPVHREVRRSNISASGLKGSVSGLLPKSVKRTPLPDRITLEEILEKLQKKDTYGVFAEPVDPEELPDYHDVIEHPMDFSTVRRKLVKNVYCSLEQFEDDVFLICSNAMQYNAPDTIYFRQAHSIQELARSKFQKLREGVKQPETIDRPKAKIRRVQEWDPAIGERHQVRTNLGEKHTSSRREERETMQKVTSRIKLVDKKRKREERKATSPLNHPWEERGQSTISSNSNNKRSFSRFGQEHISSDISSAGTHASAEEAGTSLSASHAYTHNDRIDEDGCAHGHDRDHDVNINNSSIIKDKSVELNVLDSGFVDNNNSSLGETQSDKAGELSVMESPSRPVDTPVVDENRCGPDEIKKPVDMNRRKTYGMCERQHQVESDPIFDIFADDPKQLLNIGLGNKHVYARSLARFAAFLGPSAWKIVSSRIERSLPAGTKFGRGWVEEFEPLSSPVIFVANRVEKPRSSRSMNNVSAGTHLGTSKTPGASDRNNMIFGAATCEPVGDNNNIRDVQQRSNTVNPSTVGNPHVRKHHTALQSTVEMPQPFLKPPEVSTPRQMIGVSMGQNHNSVQTNSTRFITKQQVTNKSIANAPNPSNGNNIGWSNVSQGARTNQPGNLNRGASASKGFSPPVQSVKKEVESPKAMGPIPGQNSWISFVGPSYETKPSLNTVPASVPVSVPAFLGTRVRPTANNVSHNAPVWRVVNTSPSGNNTASNASQPTQGQNCNSNPGFVMFPVQRDLTRLQGQLPWQGFMPNNQHMQMKEPQALRPDLNIGFSSPGSPPGQSSGINLEAQQPDLALQL